MLNSRAPITLIVKKIITETADTRSFQFAAIDDKPVDFSYKAGQFLTFIYYNKMGEEVRKNYSISSSPDLNEPLTITVKRIDNGEFSRKLVDSTRVGDELLCDGAAGFFTLPENTRSFEQIFLIVAGSGITPAFSLLKTVLHCHPFLSVVLIYSNSSEKKTIFYKELKALSQLFPERLKIEFLFSNATDLLKARLNTSLLERFWNQHRLTSTEKLLFYICGPTDYMRMIHIYLNIRKVPPAHVKKEIFAIEKPLNLPQPPDKNIHDVSLIINGVAHRIPVKYPVTILQAAKKNGIKLPYSCESGQCGACAVRCIKGSVWMYYNEVLTDADLAEGTVLTCTGYPINGDVTLAI